MIWYILLALIVGIILGIILTKKLEKKPKIFGYLNVYESTEPGEDPYLYLDLDIPTKYICREKYVVFKVSLK